MIRKVLLNYAKRPWKSTDETSPLSMKLRRILNVPQTVLLLIKGLDASPSQAGVDGGIIDIGTNINLHR